MATSTRTPIQLLDAKTYIADLVNEVSRAKHRIYLMTLIFTDDESTHPLVEALITAAGRGVKVVITADSYTYTEFGGVLSPAKRSSPRSKVTTATVTRLTSAGISFTWLGAVYKRNPFSGVTHTKWSVVDDVCYSFGGVNLFNGGISSVDYMFRFTSSEIARQLIKEQGAIMASTPSHPYPGHTYTTDFGTFYIDSGIKHDSPIYDHALALAQKATRILYVSQYCPSGPLAEAIRSTSSEIYFNTPKLASFPTNLFLFAESARQHIKSLYTKNQYLHAKFMIFTLPSGEKVAVAGSHNFSHSGVAFGTREIALETREHTIIAQLEAFREKNVY